MLEETFWLEKTPQGHPTETGLAELYIWPLRRLPPLKRRQQAATGLTALSGQGTFGNNVKAARLIVRKFGSRSDSGVPKQYLYCAFPFDDCFRLHDTQIMPPSVQIAWSAWTKGLCIG
jgi:hypothetical protein